MIYIKQAVNSSPWQRSQSEETRKKRKKSRREKKKVMHINICQIKQRTTLVLMDWKTLLFAVLNVFTHVKEDIFIYIHYCISMV
jgi:hypothetical protein